MAVMLPELITVVEIATRLHTNKWDVYRMVRMPGFPRFRVGHKWAIPRGPYLAWEHSRG